MNCCNCRRDIADYSNFCYFCGVRQVQPTPPGHAPWQGKRLMRSSTDVKVAGVCAGFARDFCLRVRRDGANHFGASNFGDLTEQDTAATRGA